MSTGLQIRPVRDGRSRRRFLGLPFGLYRGEPNWVPPLRSAQRRVFAGRTAFFEHAEMALFLAERAGRAVGRIAAIHNRAHAERYGDGVGFFGFFECDPADADAAVALVGAAERWLAERGLSTLRGPVNPSMNDECGLLVHGFDSPPMVMMPYNPAPYAEMLESAGLRKCKDLFAYLIRAEDVDEGAETRSRSDRIAALLRRRHPEVTVRPLDMRNYERDVLGILGVFEEARRSNWGYVPITEREALETARQMRPVIDPEIIILAEVAGRPAGASLALRNINRGLARINGRMLPLGFVRFLREMRRIHEIRIFGIAVLEQYRNLGIAPLLMLETTRRGRAKGYDIGEASWVLEDNEMSNRTIQNALHPEHYKTYRIYEKQL